MKILVQWTRVDPTDWIEIDSADWAGLPKSADPTGDEILGSDPASEAWVFRTGAQGVEITADHYAVEHLAPGDVVEWFDGTTRIVPEGGGCRLYGWSDDPEDYPLGYRNAKVWTILGLARDPKFGNAYNTQQWVHYFADEVVRAQIPKLEEGRVSPFEDFVPPAEALTRHGIWTTPELNAKHDAARTPRFWREWTEGLPAEEVRGGKLRPQREAGRWSKAKGTRTYYCRPVALANGIHVGDSETEMAPRLLGHGGTAAATISSGNLGGGGQAIAFVFSSYANEPNTTAWPTGNYRCQLDVNSVGADITYGLLTQTVAGHFARVNSGLTSDLETKQQSQGAFTGTGLKLATTGSVSWTSGNASDRFECTVSIARPANHGTQSLTLNVNDADAFADGPWTNQLDDAIVVSDTTTVLKMGGVEYTRSANDSVSVGDTTSIEMSFGRTVNDTAAVTDAVSVEMTFARSANDSVSVADTVSAEKEIGATVADSASVTDSTATEETFGRSANDSVSVTDAAAIEMSFDRSANDSVSVSDSTTVEKSIGATVNDSVAASDTTAAAMSFDRSANDSVSVTDNVTGELVAGAIDRTVSDTITVTDLDLTAGPPFVISDKYLLPGDLRHYDSSVEVSTTGSDVTQWGDKWDNLGNLVAPGGQEPQYTASDADFNGLPSIQGNGSSQYMQASWAIPQGFQKPTTWYIVFKWTNVTAFDTILGFFSHSASQPKQYFGSGFQSLAGHPNWIASKYDDTGVSQDQQAPRTYNDTIVVAYRQNGTTVDLWVNGLRVMNGALQSVGTTSLTRFRAFAGGSISPGAYAAVKIARMIFFSQAHSDATVEYTQALLRDDYQLPVQAFLVESAVVTDTAAIEVTFERSANDAVSVADSVSAGFELSGNASDAVSVADSVSADLTKERSANDTATVSDTTSAEMTFERTLADAVSVTDARTAQIAGTVTGEANDAISVTETLTAEATFERSANDAVSVADNVSAEAISGLLFDRSVNDAIVVTDTIESAFASKYAFAGAQHDWNAELGVTLSGPNVTNWLDQFRGLDAASQGNPPAIVAADPDFNGLDSIEGDGTGELLEAQVNPTWAAFSGNDRPMTWYAVLKYVNPTSFDRFMGFSQIGVGTNPEIYVGSDAESVPGHPAWTSLKRSDGGVSTSASGGYVFKSPMTYVFKTTGALATIRAAGLQVAFGGQDVTVTTVREFQMFTSRDLTGNASALKLARVLLFNEEHDAATIAQVEALLRADYQLPIEPFLFDRNNTVTDTTSAAMTFERSANDAVSVTDNVTAQVQATIDRSASDAIVVAETLSTSVDYQRDLSDAISVSDLAGAGLSVETTTSDAASVTDSTSIEMSFGRDLSDTATTAEATAIEMSFDRNANDSVSVSDSTATEKLIGADVTDAISVTEALALDAQYSRSATDALVVTDASDIEATFERSASDAVSVSDSITTEKLIGAVVSDAISTSEALALDVQYSRNANDALVVTETSDIEATFERSASDAVSVNDSIVSEVTLERSASDAASVTETFNAATDYRRSANDAVSVSDSAGFQIFGLIDLTISDAVSTSEQVARDRERFRLAADIASVIDSVAVAGTINIELSDSLDVTESLSRNPFFYSFDLSDSVEVTDDADRSITIFLADPNDAIFTFDESAELTTIRLKPRDGYGMLSMIRGTTKAFDFTIKRSGAPVDLTGAELWLTAKRYITDDDADAIFQLTLSAGDILLVGGATAGAGKVTIPNNATEVLEDVTVDLFMDMKLREGNGRYSAQREILRVFPNVTLAL